jgi:hypothetical protein
MMVWFIAGFNGIQRDTTGMEMLGKVPGCKESKTFIIIFSIAKR